MAAKSRTSAQQHTVPDDVPASVPSFVGTPDHSFTLQAVMELQRSVGALTSSVNALIEHQKESTKKIDRMEDKLSGVTHKMYAAGVVLVLVLSAAGWLLNASWGLLKDVATPAIKAAIEQPSVRNKP